MKTLIIITGSGISSKRLLLRKIRVCDSQVNELPFNNYKIEFETKKEAIKALSEAYQDMRSDWDYKDFIDYARGRFLSYDAGTARIN
jgi:hypothetical protein